MKCQDCGGDHFVMYYPFLDKCLCLRCWMKYIYGQAQPAPGKDGRANGN